METKHITTTGTIVKAQGARGDEGRVEAFFSTLDPYVDLDGDTTAASAFTPGAEVPMIWGHSWGSPPIGLGRLAIEPTRAIWKGRLFLDTTAGKDAFQVMKHLQHRQEFSWGFKVLDHDYVQRAGRTVRRILKAEVYEISPVLKGAAGEGASGILSMKQRARGGYVSQEEAMRVRSETEAAIARSMGVPIPYSNHELWQRELRKARALGVNV